MSSSPPALTCDVCGRPALGVASSGVGPISYAYCRTCLDHGAEPLGGFVYLYDFVSHDGEGLRSEVYEWTTWWVGRPGDEGRYITFAEYVKERHKGPICEVHRVHVREWVCDLCDYDEHYANLPPYDPSEGDPFETVDFPATI